MIISSKNNEEMLELVEINISDKQIKLNTKYNKILKIGKSKKSKEGWMQVKWLNSQQLLISDPKGSLYLLDATKLQQYQHPELTLKTERIDIY